MHSNFAPALKFAAILAAAIAAAAFSSNARADDITLDGARFESTRSRAEVLGELMKTGGRDTTGEWSMQLNEPAPWTSSYTSGQAQSLYKFSRDEVHAVTSEDSGSSYFKRSVAARHTATMGGAPARIEIYGDESE